MGKTKIRTTITPGEVIEVGPEELLDLERQGLVKKYESGPKAKPADTDDKKGE